MQSLSRGDDLFPGIIGYEDTVIPEINLGLIAGHDLLFLGEKGQAKSRLMRLIARFLDPELPYLDIPSCPVHEDPYRPITSAGRQMLAELTEAQVPIAWWPRERRYAERLAPGTKFADVIGEIDPARLASGTSDVGRGGAAFRTDSPHAPGDLCHERAARARRIGPGRPVQHSRGARRADPRLSGAVRHRRAGPLFRESGHVQSQRQGDSATERPYRLGDPHALPRTIEPRASRSSSKRRRSTWTASFPWRCPTSCGKSWRR